MLAADVLVTDYSSIVFDFRLTGKPIVVYVPDLERYRNVERGLYGGWPERAGWPWTCTQSQLVDTLSKTVEDFPWPVGRVDPAPIMKNLGRVRRWILASLDVQETI